MATKVYYKAVSGIRDNNIKKIFRKYNKTCEKKRTRFAEKLVVKWAIFCYGFIIRKSDLKEHNWMAYNIQLLKDGLTFKNVRYGSDNEK